MRLMFISDVANQFGLAPSTLRYYEAQGLIAPTRDHNGYRVYGPETVEQLQFVREAKQLGLSLLEIVELARTVEYDTCTRVRKALHPQLRQRLNEIDTRLASLQGLRQRIVIAVKNVDQCPDSEGQCRSECVFLAQNPDNPSECAL